MLWKGGLCLEIAREMRSCDSFPEHPRGTPALPRPARPKRGEGPVGRLGVDPEKGQTRGTLSRLSGHATFPLHPPHLHELRTPGGQNPTCRVHCPKFIRRKLERTDNARKKRRKKEKPSMNHKTSLLPSTLPAKSLGILFQTLSLGEKNEIRFKRVFMENRFSAQCRLSPESLALGRPRLG